MLSNFWDYSNTPTWNLITSTIEYSSLLGSIVCCTRFETGHNTEYVAIPRTMGYFSDTFLMHRMNPIEDLWITVMKIIKTAIISIKLLLNQKNKFLKQIVELEQEFDVNSTTVLNLPIKNLIFLINQIFFRFNS